jgi:hypothetical protein
MITKKGRRIMAVLMGIGIAMLIAMKILLDGLHLYIRT